MQREGRVRRLTGRKFSDRGFCTAGRHIAGQDLRFAAGKATAPAAAGLAIMLVLIPFSTAAIPQKSVFNINYTHQQLKFRFFLEDLSGAVAAAAVLIGVVLALALFGFLHDKRETTVFFALPVTRTALLAHRLLVGAGAILLIHTIPMGISLALNCKALGYYPGEGARCGYLIAGLVLVSLVSMLITTAGCVLSGTRGEAVLAAAGLLLLPYLVLFGVQRLFSVLFFGNPYGAVSYTGMAAEDSAETILPDLTEKFAFLNPFGFFTDALTKHNRFYRPLATEIPEQIHPAVLYGWLAVAVGLVLADLLFLRFRKNENAGISGAGRAIPALLVAETAFASFSTVLNVLYPMKKSLAWAGALICVAAVWLVWKFAVFRSPVSAQSFRQKCFRMAILPCACIGICLGAAGVVRGVSQSHTQDYIQSTAVTSVQVSAVGDPSQTPAVLSGTSTGRGFYFTAQYTLTSSAEISAAQSIHEEILQARAQTIGKDTADFTRSVVPYDICFSYTKTDGSTAVFYYDTVQLSALAELLTLEDTDSVSTARAGMLSGETTDSRTALVCQTGEIYLTDRLYAGAFQLQPDDTQRAELLDCLAADLKELTVQQRYFPQTTVQGILLFTQDADYDLAHFGYRLNNAVFVLTEDYTHTLDFLEQQGALALLEETPTVETLVLQPFDPFTKVKAFDTPMSFDFLSYTDTGVDSFLVAREYGKNIVITNPERIAAILPNLKNNWFMGGGGFLAAVKVNGSEQFVYLFLPAEYTALVTE